MKFVSIMGAYQTVLNSYYLHFAFFIAIMTMPRHRKEDYLKLLKTADLPGDEDAAELCLQLNKGMFELAVYCHLFVGSLIFFGTHQRRLFHLWKEFTRKRGYCVERKIRKVKKSLSESNLIVKKASSMEIQLDNTNQERGRTPKADLKSSLLQDDSILQPGTVLHKTLEGGVMQASLESSKFSDYNFEKAQAGTNESKKRKSNLNAPPALTKKSMSDPT
jgi:hypothetical protein